jgi:hypothetical protein
MAKPKASKTSFQARYPGERLFSIQICEKGYAT